MPVWGWIRSSSLSAVVVAVAAGARGPPPLAAAAGAVRLRVRAHAGRRRTGARRRRLAEFTAPQGPRSCPRPRCPRALRAELAAGAGRLRVIAEKRRRRGRRAWIEVSARARLSDGRLSSGRLTSVDHPEVVGHYARAIASRSSRARRRYDRRPAAGDAALPRAVPGAVGVLERRTRRPRRRRRRRTAGQRGEAPGRHPGDPEPFHEREERPRNGDRAVRRSSSCRRSAPGAHGRSRGSSGSPCVLGHCHQLGHEQVDGPQDAHRDCGTPRPPAPLDQRLVNDEAGGLEDQVDEQRAVVGLEEPGLGRPVAAHPEPDHQRQRALGVHRPDEEVEVVVGLGPAVRPARDPAADHERDTGLAEGLGLRLQGREHLLDRALPWRLHAHAFPTRRGPQPCMTSRRPGKPRAWRRIRIAVAGDVHAAAGERSGSGGVRRLDDVDLVLLAGDLTTAATPRRRGCSPTPADLGVPVFAVLGTTTGTPTARARRRADGRRVRVLERSTASVEVDGAARRRQAEEASAASRTPRSRTSASRSCGACTRSPPTTLPRSSAASARSTTATCGSSSSTTRRRSPPSAPSPRDLGLPRLRPAGRPSRARAGPRRPRPRSRRRLRGLDRRRPRHNVSVQVTGRDFWVFELDAGKHRPRVE